MLTMYWVPNSVLGSRGVAQIIWTRLVFSRNLHFILFFKFLFLLYFTLQYCIGFAIHWHESATGVHEFPNMKPPYYHVRNKSPVCVQYRIQDAWGWCTGMIQREDNGWEGGSCLGTHVHPWWIHVNVWQNQYSIVK